MRSVIGICSYFCLNWTGVCSTQPGLVLNTFWLCSVGRGNDNDVKVDSTYATSFHASVFLNGDGTCTVKGAFCFVCVICMQQNSIQLTGYFADVGSTNKTWIRSPGDSKHVELQPQIDYTIKEDFRFRVANINYKLKFT